MNKQAIIAALPPYYGESVLITDKQDTDDIMKAVLNKHDRTRHYYDRICLPFWKGNSRDTAKAIFDFLKKHVKYDVEGTRGQSVKTPSALLVEGVGDCKHYSLFINGVFEALKRAGYPVDSFYRFAAYDKSRRPKHVFAVVIDQGREVFVDPVLSSFDKRFPMYNHKVDKRPGERQSIGELYDISGVPGRDPHWTDWTYGPGTDQIGFLKKFVHSMKVNFANAKDFAQRNIDSAKGDVQRVRHGMDVNLANVKDFAQRNIDSAKGDVQKLRHGMDVNLANVKDFAQRNIDSAKGDIKTVAKTVKKVFLKIAGAASRNAFMLLLKANVFNYAVQLWKKGANDKNSANWKRISSTWKDIGGNPEVLYNNIRRGVDFYNKRHPNSKVSGMPIVPVIVDDYDEYDSYSTKQISTIGAEPTTLATISAILAAAAPVMALLAVLFKQLNIQKQGEFASVEANPSLLMDPSTAAALGIDVSSGTDSNGNPVLSVDNIDPSVLDADGSGFDVEYSADPDNTMSDFTDKLKSFYRRHKTPINIALGVTAAAIVIPQILPPKKRRR